MTLTRAWLLAAETSFAMQMRNFRVKRAEADSLASIAAVPSRPRRSRHAQVKLLTAAISLPGTKVSGRNSRGNTDKAPSCVTPRLFSEPRSVIDWGLGWGRRKPPRGLPHWRQRTVLEHVDCSHRKKVSEARIYSCGKRSSVSSSRPRDQGMRACFALRCTVNPCL